MVPSLGLIRQGLNDINGVVIHLTVSVAASLAHLQLAAEVDVHLVRELEGVHPSVGDDIGAGAADVKSPFEIFHLMRPVQTAVIIEQSDLVGSLEVVAVVSVAVLDENVVAGPAVLDVDHHAQLVSDLGEALQWWSKGTAAKLDLHPGLDVVAAPGKLDLRHALQVRHGDRGEGHHLLQLGLPVAGDLPGGVPGVLHHGVGLDDDGVLDHEPVAVALHGLSPAGGQRN